MTIYNDVLSRGRKTGAQYTTMHLTSQEVRKLRKQIGKVSNTVMLSGQPYEGAPAQAFQPSKDGGWDAVYGKDGKYVFIS